MTELPEKIMGLYDKISALEDEKEKLLEEQSDAVKEENKPLIMAEIFAESAGTVPFTLRYKENTGGWRPKYEVRYMSGDEPLDVCMKALVPQNTDEDWKHVKVTLYSGNPAVSHGLPVLDPTHVSVYVDPPVFKGRGKGNACEMRVEDGGCIDDEEPIEEAAPLVKLSSIKMQEAEVSEEETMSAFILPDLKDILKGTDGNIVVLQSFKVSADYRILSIPRVDTRAFLTADIARNDWSFRAAYAAVYIRGLYAGEVYVDPDTDTENFSLSLGQDERLSVTRTELPRKTQDALLKNQRKQTRTSRIKLLNTSKEEVKVLLKDQIPVSTDKAVTVEVINLSEGVVNEEKGEVCWEFTAEPGNTREFEISYCLAWPKDRRLSEKTVRG